MPVTSKSQETQVSDTLYMTYSSFDESINEPISPINYTKEKESNIEKDVQSKKQDQIVSRCEHSNIQKDLQTKKQVQIGSSHESSHGPHSAMQQSSSKTTFHCFHRYNIYLLILQRVHIK